MIAKKVIQKTKLFVPEHQRFISYIKAPPLSINSKLPDSKDSIHIDNYNSIISRKFLRQGQQWTRKEKSRETKEKTAL
jgi:hypothetical protein